MQNELTFLELAVIPCDGLPPIMDKETGQEYDCGSTRGKQKCPGFSYCHQTPTFSKCCAFHTKSDFSLHTFGAKFWFFDKTSSLSTCIF